MCGFRLVRYIHKMCIYHFGLVFSTNELMCTRAQLLQSCPTLCDPMDWGPPGSSVHGILQTRILEWVAMPCTRGSSQPRDQTHVFCVSCIAGRFFTTEPPQKPHMYMYVDRYNYMGIYTPLYLYMHTYIHTVSVFHFCCNKLPQSSVQSPSRVRLFATP